MIKANSPNPQFFRDALVNLDGKWKFFSQSVDGVKEILVPYAPESELSLIGYTDYITECEYEREFEILEPFTGQRLALKFGAVNYEAKVFLNGEAVGEHSGGYHGHKTDVYDYHDYGAPEDVEKHIKEIEDEDKMEIPALYAPDFAGEENLRYKKGLPINVSEYGGIIYDASAENGWGYSKCGSEEDFIARYVRLTKAILNADKISGFCYTQLYDVEQEQNGLYLRAER